MQVLDSPGGPIPGAVAVGRAGVHRALHRPPTDPRTGRRATGQRGAAKCLGCCGARPAAFRAGHLSSGRWRARDHWLTRRVVRCSAYRLGVSSRYRRKISAGEGDRSTHAAAETDRGLPCCRSVARSRVALTSPTRTAVHGDRDSGSGRALLTLPIRSPLPQHPASCLVRGGSRHPVVASSVLKERSLPGPAATPVATWPSPGARRSVNLAASTAATRGGDDGSRQSRKDWGQAASGRGSAAACRVVRSCAA